jgi:alpha-tubulin suppressor-like RCC1 family protein
MMQANRPKTYRASNRPSALSSTSFSQVLQRRGNTEYERLNRSMAQATKQVSESAATQETEEHHKLALLSDEYVRQATLLDQLYFNEGSLMAMGNDESNQIGFYDERANSEDNSGIPPSFIAVSESMHQISAGGTHGIALSMNGVPYTWGNEEKGQLGRVIQSTTQALIPMPVTGFQRHDTGAVEDGKIIQVAAGDAHSLFLSASGAVYHCGTYRDVCYHQFCDKGGDIGIVEGIHGEPVHVHQMPGPVIEVITRDSWNAAILADRSLVTWGT